MHYRYRETVYHITVLQTRDGSQSSVIADGVELHDGAIPLLDDHQEHSVAVRIHAQRKSEAESPQGSRAKMMLWRSAILN